MSQQIVSGHLEGMHSQASSEPVITLSFYDLTGSLITKANANYRRGTLRHVTDIKKIRKKGVTASMLNAEESIECQFDFIADGTSRVDASAGATSSAQMPPTLARVKVENAPAIKCGWLSDGSSGAGAINGDTSYPWIYEGEGSITMDDEDAWGGTITLHRYKGILTYSVVVNS